MHVLGDKSTLVDQGDDRAVLDRILDGVRRSDDAPETADGGLFLGKHRRAREAHITGLREQATHVRRQGPVLGAVTLVDQHDDVRVLVLETCGAFHRRLELIDDRRDDIGGLLLDHREEFGPRTGMAHKTVTVLEGLLDLHI